MTPELEVLEQVIDSDLPLSVIARLFPGLDHCVRAIGAMLDAGDVRVVDPYGQAVPSWRWHELQETKALWSDGTQYRLAITDAGAKRIGSHTSG